jgi:hypothetical protein
VTELLPSTGEVSEEVAEGTSEVDTPEAGAVEVVMVCRELEPDGGT